MRWLLALFLLPVLPLAAACGGGDDDDEETATPTVNTEAGPPLNDTDYLETLCTGLSNYQDALLSKQTAEEIGEVITDFADEMRAVNPPEDVSEFHLAFVSYLEAAVADPTSLVTTQPPLPDEDVRERLANKVNDIPECKYPTFLGEPRQ